VQKLRASEASIPILESCNESGWCRCCGSGFMGRTNAETVARYLKSAKLISLNGESSSPSLAAEYGVESDADLDIILRRPEIHAVMISTPHAAHVADAVAANAGKRFSHLWIQALVISRSMRCVDGDLFVPRWAVGTCRDGLRTVPHEVARNGAACSVGVPSFRRNCEQLRHLRQGFFLPINKPYGTTPFLTKEPRQRQRIYPRH
jgi:hypothetical protein